MGANANLANVCEQYIELFQEHDAGRAEVERFIRVVFRKAYGAKITQFMPQLLALGEAGHTLAALGVRPAAEYDLFLEHYLPRPIESVIAQKLARPIDRAQVVEVGNLASAHAGSARTLFVHLTALLANGGYEWVVCTATQQVRNAFARLGMELTFLAHAQADCLGDAAQSWGSYYAEQPQVMVGQVSHGMKLVRPLLAQQSVALRSWSL